MKIPHLAHVRGGIRIILIHSMIQVMSDSIKFRNFQCINIILHRIVTDAHCFRTQEFWPDLTFHNCIINSIQGLIIPCDRVGSIHLFCGLQ